ncbi:hypothetical protein G9A89_023244 [Geosiphon pyriformis]|nr:hypothetical protein G9A89_023244 [Geosiphon pyriformis]
MEGSYEVRIPKNHLPATIHKVFVSEGETVHKRQSLFRYQYMGSKNVTLEDEKTGLPLIMPTPIPVFEELKCPAVGKVTKILVKEDQVVTGWRQATLLVEEPCSHAVQLKGLCALCGKDLTITDFTGINDTQRATINMAHSVAGLTVSQAEAQRLEHQTAERLQKCRKLSLIVDLDQTIIHTTVDPTVEKWMMDSDNPNHPATKDIRKFVLPDHPTVFYMKIRPDTAQFLKEVSNFFELHIYTMGTRNYASAVANIIDPKQEIFSERILSRDENGSMTQKNIRRLFPCDDSMVVVIDDRADVWQWAPNVIKVQPYDFFVGIGDINASFLPKMSTIASSKTKPSETESIKNIAKESIPAITITKADGFDLASPVSEFEEQLQQNGSKANLEETDKIDDLTRAIQQKEQVEEIEKQVHDRPLAQLEQKPTHDREKPVLVDDDTELLKLLTILKEIHQQYFAMFDQENGMADVALLIPRMKEKVLKGVHILFTHVIPTNQPKQSSDIWNLAISFGAQCSESLNSYVTHLVAGEKGTEKVKAARRRPNIFIVSKEWLIDSIKKWERQPEELYFFEETNMNSSPDGNLVASEFEKNEGATPGAEETEAEEPQVKSEVTENFYKVDWGNAMHEVDEVIGESGDTSTWDDSEAESGSESGSKPLKRIGMNLLSPDNSREYKRFKQSPLRHSSYPEDDGKPDMNRKKIPVSERRSRVFEVKETTYEDDSYLGQLNLSSSNLQGCEIIDGEIGSDDDNEDFENESDSVYREQDDFRENDTNHQTDGLNERPEVGGEEDEDDYDDDDYDDDFLAAQLEAELLDGLIKEERNKCSKFSLATLITSFCVASIICHNIADAVPFPNKRNLETSQTFSNQLFNDFTKFAHYSRAAYCNFDGVRNWDCGEDCDEDCDALSGSHFRCKAWDSSLCWNLCTDVKFLFVDYPLASNAKIHRGFLEAYQSLNEDVVEQVQSLIKTYLSFSVRVAGRSLGGALSVIFALDLKNQIPSLVSNQNFFIYTYGQPRIDNNVLAKYIDSQISVNRITHTSDLLTHIPSRLFGYQHSSGEYWIKNDLKTFNTSTIYCDGTESSKYSNSIPILQLKMTAHMGPYFES